MFDDILAHIANQAQQGFVLPAASPYSMKPGGVLDLGMGDATEGAKVYQGGANGPEKIVTPAVLVDGKVFTGAYHPDALEEAAKATGRPFDTLAEQREGLDGFLTSHGRYVTREQAGKMLQSGGSADKGYMVGNRLSGEAMPPWSDADTPHFLSVIQAFHGKPPAQ